MGYSPVYVLRLQSEVQPGLYSARSIFSGCRVGYSPVYVLMLQSAVRAGLGTQRAVCDTYRSMLLAPRLRCGQCYIRTSL